MAQKILPFLLIVLLWPAASHAGCISPAEAGRHVGETKCVAGKVLRVARASDGMHYLEFCGGSRACSFSAVIYPDDLRHVGDVRQLEGKFVEVHGDISEY